jgi:hypothetical protein
MYAPKLCTQSMEEVMSFLINLPPNVDADILLANIDQIRISKRKFEEMRNRMTSELHVKNGTTPTSQGSSSNERRPSGSSTSTFRTIKRAIRTTFLGTSSSSSSAGHDNNTPHSSGQASAGFSGGGRAHSSSANDVTSVRDNGKERADGSTDGSHSMQRNSLTRGEAVRSISAHSAHTTSTSSRSSLEKKHSAGDIRTDDHLHAGNQQQNNSQPAGGTGGEYFGGGVDTYQPRMAQGQPASRRNSGNQDVTTPSPKTPNSDCTIC